MFFCMVLPGSGKTELGKLLIEQAGKKAIHIKTRKRGKGFGLLGTSLQVKSERRRHGNSD